MSNAKPQYRIKALVRDEGTSMYKTTIDTDDPAEAILRVIERLGLAEPGQPAPAFALFVQSVHAG